MLETRFEIEDVNDRQRVHAMRVDEHPLLAWPGDPALLPELGTAFEEYVQADRYSETVRQMDAVADLLDAVEEEDHGLPIRVLLVDYPSQVAWHPGQGDVLLSTGDERDQPFPVDLGLAAIREAGDALRRRAS